MHCAVFTCTILNVAALSNYESHLVARSAFPHLPTCRTCCPVAGDKPVLCRGRCSNPTAAGVSGVILGLHALLCRSHPPRLILCAGRCSTRSSRAPSTSMHWFVCAGATISLFLCGGSAGRPQQSTAAEPCRATFILHLLPSSTADMRRQQVTMAHLVCRQMQQQGRAEPPSTFMRRRTTSDSEEVPQAALSRTSAGSGSSSVGQNPFMQANAKRQAGAPPAGRQQPDKTRRAISPPRSVFAAAEQKEAQAVTPPRSVFAASRPKDVRAPPSAFGADGENDANLAFGSPQEKDVRAAPSPFTGGAAGPVGPVGPSARGRQAPAGDEKPWEVRPPTSVFGVSSQPLLQDPVQTQAASGGSPMGQKDVRPPQSAFGAQAPVPSSGLTRVSPGPSPTAGPRPLPDSFFQRRSATEQEVTPAVSGQQQPQPQKLKSYALPESPAAAQKAPGRGAPGQAGPKGESIFMDDSDEGSDSPSSFSRERAATRGNPRTLASERRGQAPAEAQQKQPAAPAAAAAQAEGAPRGAGLPGSARLAESGVAANTAATAAPAAAPTVSPNKAPGVVPPKQRKLQQKKEEPSKPKQGDFYLGEDLADALGPSAGTPPQPATEDMSFSPWASQQQKPAAQAAKPPAAVNGVAARYIYLLHPVLGRTYSCT